MNELTENRIVPEKYRVVSGSVLKLIAVITMLIDHIAAFLVVHYKPALTVYCSILGNPVSIYYIMRYIGRLAFPLYCFLLTEGFIHTRNRLKYGLSLGAFALLSELPWNLIHTDTWHYEKQNVFFTLLLGYLGLCAFEYFSQNLAKQAAALSAVFFAAVFLQTDYGLTGLALILIIYLLRKNPIPRGIIGCCILSNSYISGIAFIPVAFYNGKRGFIKGTVSKYIFYYFYPVHLLVLYLIKQRLKL